jgi:hypothetical protein
LKSGSLNLLEPSGPVQACNGTALPLTGGNKMYHLNCLIIVRGGIPIALLKYIIREYNLSMQNFNVAIIDCSYVSAVASNRQAVNQKCKKEIYYI